MIPLWVLSLLVVLYGLGSCASQEDAFHRRFETKAFDQRFENNAFDHFWLVLTWPPTFCRTNPCNSDANIARFTIHGLWPKNKRGDTLQSPVQENADLSWFKYLSLDLVTDLREYWPSLSQKRTNEEFWLLEWDRHGRMQAEFGPEEYFRNALSITKKAGDIVAALENQRQEPSNSNRIPDSFTQFEFADALKSVTGTDQVMLMCDDDNALRELRICVNGDATDFIACNANEMKQASCRRGEPIILPLP